MSRVIDCLEAPEGWPAILKGHFRKALLERHHDALQADAEVAEARVKLVSAVKADLGAEVLPLIDWRWEQLVTSAEGHTVRIQLPGAAPIGVRYATQYRVDGVEAVLERWVRLTARDGSAGWYQVGPPNGPTYRDLGHALVAARCGA